MSWTNFWQPTHPTYECAPVSTKFKHAWIIFIPRKAFAGYGPKFAFSTIVSHYTECIGARVNRSVYPEVWYRRGSVTR